MGLTPDVGIFGCREGSIRPLRAAEPHLYQLHVRAGEETESGSVGGHQAGGQRGQVTQSQHSQGEGAPEPSLLGQHRDHRGIQWTGKLTKEDFGGQGDPKDQDISQENLRDRETFQERPQGGLDMENPQENLGGQRDTLQ